MVFKFVSKTIMGLLPIILIMAVVTACGAGNSNTNTNNTSPKQNPSVKSGSEKEIISIATTPIGSSINAVGSGLASVISTNSSIQLSVKPFAGLTAWGPLVNSGEVQIGFATGPELVWAFKGEKGFERNKNIRMLVRGNFLKVTGMAVRKDTDINTIADLKGKRVASDYPGSIIGKNIMEAALVSNGLSWDDVKNVPIPSAVAGIEALRDDRVDGAFALTSTTPIILETHNAVGLRALHFLDNTKPEDIKDIPQDVIDKITGFVPSARMTVVEANGYIAQDTLGIEYPTMTVASSHLSDDTAYSIMETLWAHYEELHPIHLWLKSWTPEIMFDPNPSLPYHPGAVKFFKDKGLWNDDVEKIQQDLLKLAS